jgi:hypothetical protein
MYQFKVIRLRDGYISPMWTDMWSVQMGGGEVCVQGNRPRLVAPRTAHLLHRTCF